MVYRCLVSLPQVRVRGLITDSFTSTHKRTTTWRTTAGGHSMPNRLTIIYRYIYL